MSGVTEESELMIQLRERIELLQGMKRSKSPAQRVLDDVTRVVIGLIVCVFGVTMLLLAIQAHGEGITPWPGVILGTLSLVCGIAFILAGVLPEEE